MDKTITRDERERMLSAMAKRVGMLETQGNRKAILSEILEIAGFTVEPAPILPDVTPGVWVHCCGYDAENGKYYILAEHVVLAEVYSRADQLVMAGSKKLVELLVAGLRSTSNYRTEQILPIIDQLEKMGVAV